MTEKEFVVEITPTDRIRRHHRFEGGTVTRFKDPDKTRLNVLDFGEAYTFAIYDLKTNWRRYRERYEQEVEEWPRISRDIGI